MNIYVDRIKERLEKERVDLREWVADSKWEVETGYETGEYVEISTFSLKRALTTNRFTRLFDDWLNSGGKNFGEGVQIGLRLRGTHRTLQGLAVNFCLGIICGLAEQQYADDRNRQAVETAQKISQMVDSGEIKLQRYI